MSVQILKRKTNDITVLELSGNFTWEGDAEFKKHVTAKIKGPLKLLHLSPHLLALLTLSKRNTVLATFDSEAAAMSSFRLEKV